MTCQKCHAGRGAIQSKDVTLATGELLTETSCVLCGWANFQTRVVPPTRASVRRMADAKARQVTPRRACTHVGCERTYSPINNKYRLCHVCSKRQGQWIRSAGRNPAPLLEQAGVWIDNPQFIAKGATA